MKTLLTILTIALIVSCGKEEKSSTTPSTTTTSTTECSSSNWIGTDYEGSIYYSGGLVSIMSDNGCHASGLATCNKEAGTGTMTITSRDNTKVKYCPILGTYNCTFRNSGRLLFLQCTGPTSTAPEEEESNLWSAGKMYMLNQ